jgi:hypothetical protein
MGELKENRLFIMKMQIFLQNGFRGLKGSFFHRWEGCPI